MTVIVAYKDKNDYYMGCDTQVGSTDITFVKSKIVRLQIQNQVTEEYIECLIGISGYAYMLNFIEHGFQVPKIHNNQSFINYLSNQFIKELNKQLQENNITEVDNSEIQTGGNMIVVYDDIYILDYNNAPFTIDDTMHAIGSGASYALGSMYSLSIYNDNIDTETMLSISIDAAKSFDGACGGINIIEHINANDN